MGRFKKGSEAARRYMAKIRGMRKGAHIHHSSSSRKARHTKRRTTNLTRRRYFRRSHHSGGSRGRSLARGIETTSKGLALAVPLIIEPLLNKGLSGRSKAVVALRRATGYDMDNGTFNMGYLVDGYGPYVATTAAWKAVHFINKLLRKL